MTHKEHFKRLEHMYLSAPINAFYEPEITISEKESKVRMEVQEKFYHPLNALHGSVFFKMLDEAAYFAAISVETEFSLTTSEFHMHFLKPIKKGVITAIGKLIYSSDNIFVAEARLFDEEDNEMAFGSGTFVKTRLPFTEIEGYRE